MHYSCRSCIYTVHCSMSLHVVRLKYHMRPFKISDSHSRFLSFIQDTLSFIQDFTQLHSRLSGTFKIYQRTYVQDVNRGGFTIYRVYLQVQVTQVLNVRLRTFATPKNRRFSFLFVVKMVYFGDITGCTVYVRVQETITYLNIPFPSNKQSKQPFSHENDVLHTLFLKTDFISRFCQNSVFEVVLH